MAAQIALLVLVDSMATVALAQVEDVDTTSQDSIGELSVDEVSRRLDNPLTNLWSLTFQENLSLNQGDRIDDTEISNTFFFQPALPLPIRGGKGVLIARPVLPLVTTPVLDPASRGGVDGHKTGLGDIQMVALVGPNKLTGQVWGVGTTLKFPTATDSVLGQEKWQIGPAAMYFWLGKLWTVGFLLQHWWSYAGDSSRDDVSQTDLQYVARRQLGNGWSLGMGPTVTVDWEADSDNTWTVPIGLGVTKTFRWGGVPIKARFEPQYSIVRPDDFGAVWNFRIQIAPVIPSPFGKT